METTQEKYKAYLKRGLEENSYPIEDTMSYKEFEDTE